MSYRVLLTILIFFISAGLAMAFQVPDTGITACYDAAGNQINPCPVIGQPYYGQDGNIIHNDMNFTDNGNETLTDNVTGFLWQKTADANPRTWDEAVNYCNSLSLGGYASGWRMPDLVELDSIVNLSVVSGAAINADFIGTAAAGYWTATDDPDDNTKAWVLDFGTTEDGTFTKSDTNYIRCVREVVQ